MACSGRLHYLPVAVATCVGALAVDMSAATTAEVRRAAFPLAAVQQAGEPAAVAAAGQKTPAPRSGPQPQPAATPGRALPAGSERAPAPAKATASTNRRPAATSALRLGVSLGGLVGVVLLGLILIKSMTRP